MAGFKIGIRVNSFRLELKEAIRKSKEAGAQGIQVTATYGDIVPENLDVKQRKEFLDMVTSYGLEISALCGDLGGHGFTDEEENKWKIEKSKRIIDLARDLNTNVVTTHIGVIPESRDHKRWDILRNACERLGEYGDSVDAYFAIETGPEKASVLKEFLDSLESNGVRVNMDPANMVMVMGDDPANAVYQLKDYIVHTHAKDGIMLKKINPEIIYGMVDEEIEPGEAFKEVPLGEGNVNFTEYLKALDSIGYSGYLTIEREVGD
ncbi:MAG: sugar phosphate isomerase/epimerase, partial [Ruminiclostridium sp.]|nr:sugar phosphate isomerase/epimerase [Ruminiclostridium sp.]